MTYFKYSKRYLGCIIRSVMLNTPGNYAALLSSTSAHFGVLFSVPVISQKSGGKIKKKKEKKKRVGWGGREERD